MSTPPLHARAAAEPTSGPTRAPAKGGAWAGLYRVATTLAAPAARWKARRIDREQAAPPGSLAQKMGRATIPRPAGRLLWLHGVALGEIISARPLVELIVSRWPDLRLLVTNKTMPQSPEFAALFPAGTCFQSAPLDVPQAVRRFYAHWRPEFILWIYKHPTPNYVFLSPPGCGFAIVQPKAHAPRFDLRALLAPAYRRTYGALDVVTARTAAEADGLRRVGVRTPICHGDLRLSVPALPVAAESLRALRTAVADRPRWVLASARDDEHRLAGWVHGQLAHQHPGLLTIIVPRHPHDGPRVAQDLRAQGLAVARRTAGDAIAPPTQVYVADTLGELGLWYSLCPIAVVGGSFAPRGGHNVVEPARLACAVLCGPSVRNIAAIAVEMVAAGGLQQVADREALLAALRALLDSPDRLATARQAALAFAERTAMAADAVFNALQPALQASLGRPH